MRTSVIFFGRKDEKITLAQHYQIKNYYQNEFDINIRLSLESDLFLLISKSS